MAKRRKVGHIEPSPGGGWDVRVTRGTTSDGRARTLCRHVEGTYEDADAACYALAAELGRSLAAGDSVTLAQYYRGIFRNAPSNRGRPRSRSTLRAYDAQMERHVLPEIGDVPLSRLSHGQIKAAVLGAENTHFVNPSGLDADGQHNHIWDTCVPTFLHFNIPLMLCAIVVSQFI